MSSFTFQESLNACVLMKQKCNGLYNKKSTINLLVVTNKMKNFQTVHCLCVQYKLLMHNLCEFIKNDGGNITIKNERSL